MPLRVSHEPAQAGAGRSRTRIIVALQKTVLFGAAPAMSNKNFELLKYLCFAVSFLASAGGSMAKTQLRSSELARALRSMAERFIVLQEEGTTIARLPLQQKKSNTHQQQRPVYAAGSGLDSPGAQSTSARSSSYDYEEMEELLDAVTETLEDVDGDDDDQDSSNVCLIS